MNIQWVIPAVLLVLPLFSHGQLPDTTRVDSSTTVARFSLLPGMIKTPSRQSSQSLITVLQKENSKFNLGISALNTIRGELPGMVIAPYYQVDTLTWRQTSPLLVIDGIPFNQSMRRSYNMNAFEYDEMHLILGGNGTIPYGGTGQHGAIVLHSRNGEGLTKPVIDFNTYSTYSYDNNMNEDQWQLSNSLGYSRDFGKIDLRVSTNFTSQPAGANSMAGPDQLNLRINTGLTLSKFNARLILNENSGKLAQASNTLNGNIRGFGGQATSSQATNNFLQGNLMLSYQLTNWLSVSSQGSRMSLTSEQKNTSRVLTKDDEYDAANLLLNVNKNLSPSFSVNGSAGLIFNQVQSTSTGSSLGLSFFRSYKASTQSLLFTTEIGFREKVFVGVNFRRDFVKPPQRDSTASNAYSFFGSYIFNHLLDPSSKVLTIAKIRTNFGYNDNTTDYTVPNRSINSVYPTRFKTNSFEIGLEFGLLKNRIQFIGNYFINNTFAPSPTVTDPLTGFSVTYFGLNSFDSSVKGFEIIARMKVIDKRKITVSTQLTAGRNEMEIDQMPSQTAIILPSSRTPVTLPTGTLILPTLIALPAYPSLGSPNPDWIGSWLSRANLNRFSLSMLIDVSSGGSFFYFESGSVVGRNITGDRTIVSPPDSLHISAADVRFNNSFFNNTSVVKDRTFVKLREINVGYNFPISTKIKAFASLSFRNLAVLYSASGVDPEYGASNSPTKSISVNFSLQF